ncbi:hypothetical protein HDV62DRAFT_346772 [Trichoderma sp. SZMC 28011]
MIDIKVDSPVNGLARVNRCNCHHSGRNSRSHANIAPGTSPSTLSVLLPALGIFRFRLDGALNCLESCKHVNPVIGGHAMTDAT